MANRNPPGIAANNANLTVITKASSHMFIKVSTGSQPIVVKTASIPTNRTKIFATILLMVLQKIGGKQAHNLLTQNSLAESINPLSVSPSHLRNIAVVCSSTEKSNRHWLLGASGLIGMVAIPLRSPPT